MSYSGDRIEIRASIINALYASKRQYPRGSIEGKNIAKAIDWAMNNLDNDANEEQVIAPRDRGAITEGAKAAIKYFLSSMNEAPTHNRGPAGLYKAIWLRLYEAERHKKALLDWLETISEITWEDPYRNMANPTRITEKLKLEVTGTGKKHSTYLRDAETQRVIPCQAISIDFSSPSGPVVTAELLNVSFHLKTTTRAN